MRTSRLMFIVSLLAGQAIPAQQLSSGWGAEVIGPGPAAFHSDAAIIHRSGSFSGNTRYSDVFVVANGQVYQRYYRGNWSMPGWSNWGSLGAPPGGAYGAPAALVRQDPSSSQPRIDVLVQNKNTVYVNGWSNFRNELFMKSWTRERGWSGWISLGTPPDQAWGMGTPAVVARGADFDIVVQTSSGIWQKYYRESWGSGSFLGGGYLSGWGYLGTVPGGGESELTISRFRGGLAVFARGYGQWWVKQWIPGLSWLDWQNLGSPPGGSIGFDRPASVTRIYKQQVVGAFKLECSLEDYWDTYLFVRGTDGTIYYRVFTQVALNSIGFNLTSGFTAQPWQSLGITAIAGLDASIERVDGRDSLALLLLDPSRNFVRQEYPLPWSQKGNCGR